MEEFTSQESEQYRATIDTGALKVVVWREKWLIIICAFLLSAAGTFYAFWLPEEFESQGKILPEVSSSANSSLSSLAGALGGLGIGGLDIKNSTEAIRPDLYPEVLKSTPFFLELLQHPVKTKTNQSLRFEEFYHQVVEKNELLDTTLIQKFKVEANGFYVLNRLSENRIKDLKKRIIGTFDRKSGVISIAVKMPDPVVAATLTKFSMDYLTNYVVDYRTLKNKRDVDFFKERLDAAKGKYYSNQSRRAEYSDQFQAPTIRFQSSDVQRERIEAEYRTSSTFYNTLMTKYEEAKIKLQQETPVLKVLEPPTAPTKKSEPRRSVIMLLSGIIGLLLGLAIALMRKKNYSKVFL